MVFGLFPHDFDQIQFRAVDTVLKVKTTFHNQVDKVGVF
jgi:hypothetical protein